MKTKVKINHKKGTLREAMGCKKERIATILNEANKSHEDKRPALSKDLEAIIKASKNVNEVAYACFAAGESHSKQTTRLDVLEKLLSRRG